MQIYSRRGSNKVDNLFNYVSILRHCGDSLQNKIPEKDL
jgi:hypothetical protein